MNKNHCQSGHFALIFLITNKRVYSLSSYRMFLFLHHFPEILYVKLPAVPEILKPVHHTQITIKFTKITPFSYANVSIN